MSEPIKVGDLVVVAKTACCSDKDLGYIFTVSRIETHKTECRFCHREWGLLAMAMTSNFCGFSLQELKRIPPLDELERDQIVKELTV
jgi:hypothetical protein